MARRFAVGASVAAVSFVLVIGTAGAGERPLAVERCRVSALQSVTLSAEQSGLLEVVSVREGDEVPAGHVVARIRDVAARAALARAEAQAANDVDLRYAKKASELAQAEFLSARELNQEFAGARPEAELRRLRLAAERALLQIEQAEFQLGLAKRERDELKTALEAYVVAAPFGGTVLKVHRSPGEAIRPGEPLVEVASFSRMKVAGEVPLAEIWRVRPGAPVSVRIDVPEAELPVEAETFSGRVTFVDPRVNEVTRSVTVWAEVDNRSGLLRDGLTAEMTIGAGVATPTAAGSPATGTAVRPGAGAARR